jgi:hypothetical protein
VNDQLCHFDPADPLATCEGETERANAALRDYAAMGPGRSLGKLARRYATAGGSRAKRGQPPTARLATLESWSARYAWRARVQAIDDAHRAELAALERTDREARRKARMGIYSLIQQRAAQALQSYRFFEEDKETGEVRQLVPFRDIVAALDKAAAGQRAEEELEGERGVSAEGAFAELSTDELKALLTAFGALE